MTESETTKNHSAVEASATSDVNADEETVETPMMAVWLSLAAILIAGLYGLYIGTAAKSKAKAEVPAAEHSLLWTAESPAWANQLPEQGSMGAQTSNESLA